MRPNPLETADLVKFTEEILNGKLYLLCSMNVPNSHICIIRLIRINPLIETCVTTVSLFVNISSRCCTLGILFHF